MKRFLFPAALLLLAILSGAYFALDDFAKFREERAALAQAMSKDGGDNAWDNPYFVAQAKKLAEDRFDMLYLCDSVMFSNGNPDQHTLSVLMEEKSGEKTLPIAGPGFSPVLFKEYSRIIGKIDYRPTVVFGVNLRSFSKIWAKDYSYRNLRKFLAFQDWRPTFPDWLRFKLDGSDILSFFEKRIFDDGFTDSDYFTRRGFVEDPASKLCANYAESYATPIAPDHPMLIDLLKTIKRIRSYGSEVIVYVTPIDFENIEKHCGEQTSKIARREIRNIDDALSSLDDPGVIALDLSDALGSDAFAEPEYANEHLTEKGREAVALALAKAWKEHRAAQAATP